MAILKILQYPDLRLHTKATLVTNIQDKVIQEIIDNMFETLDQAKNCAALAATQLDIQNPPSITVVNSQEENTPPFCLINPEIITRSDEYSDVEGCMSVYPGDIQIEVTRSQKITVKAKDRNNQDLTIEAEGFLARCLQHEIDHLHGIIITDYLSPLKRERLEKKITKLKKLSNES